MIISRVTFSVSIMGFSEGVFPIKYLGIPLSPKRLMLTDYDVLIQKMICRIQSWSQRSVYISRCVVPKSKL